jgi:tetratricopeptide (TPR) repeat protein
MNAPATIIKPAQTQTSEPTAAATVGDEFIALDDLNTVKTEVLQTYARQVVSEIEELQRESRWEDILSLFYPLESKLPDLVEKNLDTEIRSRMGFALGQVKRFDDAITELSLCVERDPENFGHHSSLAYTAYNSLYAAKNREIFLAGNIKARRIELAHKHFRSAQLLRPDGITNFYREGMMFKQIENKTDRALPLFKSAVGNWEALEPARQEERHQERKNYIKALYQLAGTMLATGNAKAALPLIRKCLAEDEKSNHQSLLFKYFALGKVHFHLNQLAEARDALVFAAKCAGDQPSDFVHELLARTYLAMDNPGRAWEVIEAIPVKARKPYYRWTEADILCAMKEFNRAKAALLQCQERDNRGRHKALIRLAKIEYLTEHFEQAAEYGARAVKFFQDNWTNPYDAGLFWQAAALLRLGKKDEARSIAKLLRDHNPRYPKLDKLFVALDKP